MSVVYGIGVGMIGGCVTYSVVTSDAIITEWRLPFHSQ